MLLASLSAGQLKLVSVFFITESSDEFNKHVDYRALFPWHLCLAAAACLDSGKRQGNICNLKDLFSSMDRPKWPIIYNKGFLFQCISVLPRFVLLQFYEAS